MISFELFEEIAQEAFDRLPDEIKRDLNLGMGVTPDAKPGPEGHTFIMGEYYQSPSLGRGITLYYGSFRSIMGNAPEAMIRTEIEHTVKHELRHHLERSAGVDYLGDEDREKLTKIKERFGELPSEKEVIKAIEWRVVTTIAVIVVTLALMYFLLIRYLH